jgi:hypothetical protein
MLQYNRKINDIKYYIVNIYSQKKESIILKLKKIAAVFLSVGLVFAGSGCTEKAPSFSETEITTTISTETPVSAMIETTNLSENKKPLTQTSETEEPNYDKITELDISIIDEKIAEYEDISDYKNLKSLSILFNTDAVIDLQILSGLESLETLELSSMSGNEFINSESLINLDRLNSITIENVNCSDWSFLSNLTSLKEIKLNYCLFDFIKTYSPDINDFDFSMLNNCENLESLEVINFKFDFSDISELKKLKSIDFSTTGEAGIRLENFNIISDFVLLESFTAYLVDVDNNDFSPLQNCSNLIDLTIAFTTFNNVDWLSNLTNLQNLKFKNTNLSDIKPIIELESLKSLTIMESNLSEEDLETLRKLYPQNEIIN